MVNKNVYKKSCFFVCFLGHLIHFEADLAFQNVKQSLQGYFYNCQFPNTVYKTLVCYKCPGSSSRVTQICGLGEQVSTGFTHSLMLHFTTESCICTLLTNTLAPVAKSVECPLWGLGAHGFDPGPRHIKVVKNGTSCSLLGTQTYEEKLGLVNQMSE